MSEPIELELSGFTLPANVRMQQGESGLMLGNHYSNGMTISGLVERMTYIGGGVVRIQMNQGDAPPRFLLVFSTGMVAEEKKTDVGDEALRGQRADSTGAPAKPKRGRPPSSAAKSPGSAGEPYREITSKRPRPLP